MHGQYYLDPAMGKGRLYMYTSKGVVRRLICLCECLMSQSTIFQSYQDIFSAFLG